MFIFRVLTLHVCNSVRIAEARKGIHMPVCVVTYDVTVVEPQDTIQTERALQFAFNLVTVKIFVTVD